MNNINFFSWIRDGVRQSVLLGVSDAIDQLGTPASTEELHPDVVAFLQGDSAAAVAATSPKLATQPRGSHNARKRLGRSLKDIESETPK
jgi:hypothetical protein